MGLTSWVRFLIWVKGPYLDPNQTTVQSVPWTVYPEVRRPVREPSEPSSEEVRNHDAISLLQIRLRGELIIKASFLFRLQQNEKILGLNIKVSFRLMRNLRARTSGKPSQSTATF